MNDQINKRGFKFWKKGTVIPPLQENSEAVQEPDFDEQERLDVLGISANADELVNNIHRHIILVGNKYYHFGRIHGKSKSRNLQIYDTATTHATLITDRVISIVNGNFGMMEKAIPAYEVELVALDAQHTWYKDVFHEQMKLKVNEGRLFSRFNAWFAFAAGILIILADIAVSLNLVSYFGVGELAPGATFSDKIKDVELVLFSLGIALCTVYFKLYFDEYLGGKFAYMQEHFQHLVNEKGALLKRLRWEFWVKFAVKTLILIFLLFMLYNMALYRTYFTIFGTELTEIQGITSNGGPKLDTLVHVLTNSFIGITVLLPIISGLAISVCMKILSNRRMLVDIEKKCNKAEENYVCGKENLFNSVMVMEQLRQYKIEWNNRVEKIKSIAAHLTLQYNQGYNVGYFRAHGDDFYQLVEVARKQQLDQLFNQKPDDNHENPNV